MPTKRGYMSSGLGSMDLMPHHHHPHPIGPEKLVMVQQVQQVQQVAMQPLMATALMPKCSVSCTTWRNIYAYLPSDVVDCYVITL